MQNAKGRTYRTVKYVAISVVVGVCISCRNGDAPTNATGQSAPSSATRVVTDDLGRQVAIPAEIKRVVSLAPSVTESVFAVGAGEKLVGDTTYCNYPEQAKAIAKVGDTMTPNMEAIIALKPNVVLVSTASQIEAFTNTLEKNGIAVYVTNPKDLKGVIKNMRQLGELLGTKKQGDDAADGLQHRMDDVYAKLFYSGKEWNSDHVPVKTFVQISKEPLFTIGKQSFLTDLLEWANGTSVTDDVQTAYPKLSKETAAALDPDAIILSDSPDNQEPNQAFRNSPAVKNGRVYRINADIISRPGPRLLDAYEQIAHDLHPEKFN
jgi:iron complex transport system substrate-binding protein